VLGKEPRFDIGGRTNQRLLTTTVPVTPNDYALIVVLNRKARRSGKSLQTCRAVVCISAASGGTVQCKQQLAELQAAFLTVDAREGLSCSTSRSTLPPAFPPDYRLIIAARPAHHGIHDSLRRGEARQHQHSTAQHGLNMERLAPGRASRLQGCCQCRPEPIKSPSGVLSSHLVTWHGTLALVLVTAITR